MADQTSGGIISGAMSQQSDPNAPTSSTAANTNPQTPTSAPSAAPGSPADFSNQLDSSANSLAAQSKADTDMFNGWYNQPSSTPTPAAATNLTTTPNGAAAYTPTKLGTPTQLNVGPQQTVQGQLTQIMNPNNPIIMQARTAGLEQANQSGLLDSSMAIGAAQNAAYSAAIPIAEQDAGTYNTDAATNAAAANAFDVNNQNAINAAGQFNAGAANTLTGENISASTALTNAQLAAQTSVANTTATNATSAANVATQTASAQQIAQLNNTNTTNIQSASNVQQAAAQYQTALTNIANMNMDPESKYNAELNAFNAYKNSVSLMDQKLGVPDMSGQLQFNEVDPGTGSVANTSGIQK